MVSLATNVQAFFVSVFVLPNCQPNCRLEHDSVNLATIWQAVVVTNVQPVNRAMSDELARASLSREVVQFALRER
jgi:hypothetical protein